MRRHGAIFVAGFAAFTFASAADANESATENSISCVEIKIEKLNQSDAGKKQLESVSALTLGENCGKEYNWTPRKATAASFYAISNSLLQKTKKSWAETGFATDLPNRIQKRMTIGQLNELVLQSKPALFNKILAEELMVTGSKLNADDSIDRLSLAESNIIGQKLGQLLMNLILREEFQKFFNDPDYQAPDLFILLNSINPNYAQLLTRLK